jgi:hypothetical protein
LIQRHKAVQIPPLVAHTVCQKQSVPLGRIVHSVLYQAVVVLSAPTIHPHSYHHGRHALRPLAATLLQLESTAQAYTTAKHSTAAFKLLHLFLLCA